MTRDFQERVTLSVAKGLCPKKQRFFALLRMTIL